MVEQGLGVNIHGLEGEFALGDLPVVPGPAHPLQVGIKGRTEPRTKLGEGGTVGGGGGKSLRQRWAGEGIGGLYCGIGRLWRIGLWKCGGTELWVCSRWEGGCRFVNMGLLLEGIWIEGYV